MNISILSGKGGTGKTFVSVNLANVAAAQEAHKRVTYLDCDVEEPNGHLFWNSTNIETTEVIRMLPAFDNDKCVACRDCVSFCRFNALALILDRVLLFDEVCHSCGGCELVCKYDAIHEEPRVVGKIYVGNHGPVKTVTGELNIGESMAIPALQATLRHMDPQGTNFIDCPPGTACSAMESIDVADYCILVAEPTPFGLSNLAMARELVEVMGKPCGIVINKSIGDDQLITDFCRETDTELLLTIPFDFDVAASSAQGLIASEKFDSVRKQFETLYEKILTKQTAANKEVTA